MNKTKGFLSAAGMVLAMAFTFSCSSDGGSGGEPSSSSGNEEPSSSSSVPSSSSAPPSSSSVAPSSSSVVPSSSSAPLSSSSVAVSSSSSIPSSSSFGSGNTCTADFGTVTIGSQVWAKKNLNCDVEGSKCYNDDPANCAEYGRLYDWATAKTVCPAGWHLPSDEEWTTLTDYVGNDAGTKLKATSGWKSNGTDEFGFSALPGGTSISSGSFDYAGSLGVWWSATERNASSAYWRRMNDSYSNVVGRSADDKSMLFSVRCVRD